MFSKIEIPFDQIPQLSKRDVTYQTNPEALSGFFAHAQSLEAIGDVIKHKEQHPVDREGLVDQLLKDYSNLPTTEKVIQNIEALRSERAFTIITAHQPSLLTGPLYFIYKICGAISTSRNLKKAYPDYDFIPCFITGGEDHDFEEIATIRLFNKEFTWHNDQVGAVGRMTISELKPLLDEVLLVCFNA